MVEQIDGLPTFIENTNFEKYFLVASVWGLTGYDAKMYLKSVGKRNNVLRTEVVIEPIEDDKQYPDGTTSHSLAIRVSKEDYPDIEKVEAEVKNNT